MERLLEELNQKLGRWTPEIAREVRACIAQIVELPDSDVLDVVKSRAVEQEVLDMIDDATLR
ncbi:MAG: hypothetical protein ACKVQA_23485 [Burkholderiales bacterium]